MNVYIVSDSTAVTLNDGVYSTEEKAVEYIHSRIKELNKRYPHGEWTVDDFKVIKLEVR
jgi:hypothetical protein